MLTADLHDLPSALRGLFRSLRVYRKELPFAGYSVVKDPPPPFGFGETGPLSRSRQTPNSETALSGFARHGGEYRARTGDLLVANQALSQLS